MTLKIHNPDDTTIEVLTDAIIDLDDTKHALDLDWELYVNHKVFDI